LPQEDADQRVSVQVVHIPLLQEHICLIEQEDGTPSMADIQNLL
jgi:hypothetical protein